LNLGRNRKCSPCWRSVCATLAAKPLKGTLFRVLIDGIRAFKRLDGGIGALATQADKIVKRQPLALNMRRQADTFPRRAYLLSSQIRLHRHVGCQSATLTSLAQMSGGIHRANVTDQPECWRAVPFFKLSFTDKIQ